MRRTKIFAAYLPQFHETEENNEFWGKGYTDWVSVKHAVPLFESHEQPREPLDDRYYDLSEIENIRWQAETAKRYSIDGFNIYHYWFKDNKQALQMPAELILEDESIDIEYFFTWDNSSWVRSWSNLQGNAWAPKYEADDKRTLLLEFSYGDELDWKKHFDYLLPFFQDERYLKINNKPVFMFFSTFNEHIQDMTNYWDGLAQNNGFPGLEIITQKHPFRVDASSNTKFLYQPTYSAWGRWMRVSAKLLSFCGIHRHGLKKYDYSHVWRKIIIESFFCRRKNVVLGGLVQYDDTPRRGDRGRIITNSTPELFGKYFNALYRMCRRYDKEFVLLTAWNEWGEGAYLEPDKTNGFRYLEEVDRVVKNADSNHNKRKAD